MKLPSKITLTRRQLVVITVVLALVIGIAILTTRTSPEPVAEIITYSTNQPSEEKPGDDFQWNGAPNDPKKIRIESVGIDAFIQNVGVDQNNEVAVPNNIYIAGWFVNSVRPGDKGLSIIDGHIDGITQEGAVFKALPNIANGAEISIESGDGTIKKFKVIDTQTVAAEKAASVLFSQKPKVSNQLNLITCVGDFNNQTNRYADRFIVMAEALQQN
jgi:sortase (surface protein transpeptidase)